MCPTDSSKCARGGLAPPVPAPRRRRRRHVAGSRVRSDDAAPRPPDRPPPTQPAPPTTAPPPSQPPRGRTCPSDARAVSATEVSIEWWRRNYTPGSQNAETVTSDARQGVPRALPERQHHHPGWPVRPRDRPEVRHRHPAAEGRSRRLSHHRWRRPQVRRGGSVVAAAARDADKQDFNTSAVKATTYKGTQVAYPLWIVPWYKYVNLELFKEAGVEPPREGSGRTRSSWTQPGS